MENSPAQGFRVVKCWLDEADNFQTLSFPLVFARAEDATGEIVSLLGGRDPERFSAAEREAGALLTIEEVGPAPTMVPQPCQRQQASAARGGYVGVRVFALDGQGFECATDSDEASLWVVTDGRTSRDCASYAEALDLAEESRDLGHVPAAY